MQPESEKIANPCEYMSTLAKKILPLEKFGFTETYRSNEDNNVIFSSNILRINFVWSGWDYLAGNTISIYIGRLHAPDNELTIDWEGKQCYCWHRVEPALHFIDGDEVDIVAEEIYSHQLMTEYKNSELGKSLTGKRMQPEWLLNMHALILENYAEKLFSLYDMENEKVWRLFQEYVKKVYDIRGRIDHIEPPQGQIC
jgi:hypothetical protein